MKAIIIRKHGDPDVLQFEQDVKEPECKAGEVKVEVYAVGVNHGLDTLTAKGVFGEVGNKSDALPRIPGADLAGIVESVGVGVNSVQVGDRVIASMMLNCGKCKPCRMGKENACVQLGMLGVHRDGGAAEYAIVSEQSLALIPEHLSFSEAATIPVSFSTAWHMLKVAQVKATDYVLVMSAGSGLGVAGLQIAKLFGARVIAAAGSDWKLELAKELGADEVINYNKGPMANQILEITSDVGVDLVFDGGINQETFDDFGKAIANQGRIIFSGTIGSGDGKLLIDIRDFYRRHLQLLGSAGNSLVSFNEVIDQFAAKRLKPIVYKTFPLSEVENAHKTLASREVFGKVVLLPKES